MQVKVKKRKTKVTGNTLFRGTQLEVSEDMYNMYKDEFEIIDIPKKEKVINKPKLEFTKHKPKYIDGINKNTE